MASSRELTIAVRGCAVRARRGGTGAPLLFLHGAGGLDGWLPFLEALADSFDVIAPDHPGFGGSDTPGWLDRPADLACFYLDFMDTLGLAGVHLVGHSLGGWIAAELACRNTRHLASLTLVSAAGLYVNEVPPGDLFIWSPQELAYNLVHDPRLAEARLARQPSEAELEIIIKNRFTSARLMWEPRLHDPHLHKWLHRIDVPVQILWGAEDRIFPPAYAEAWSALLPEARTTIWPACGHSPPVEKTGEFVAAVRDFAAGVQG